MVLFAWLRARGRFIFVDCIVKKSGAIGEPWARIREQGKQLFSFGAAGWLYHHPHCVSRLPAFMLPIIRGGHIPASARCLSYLHDCSWAVMVASAHSCMGIDLSFHGRGDVPPTLSAGPGFSDCDFVDLDYPGEITFYCVVLDCAWKSHRQSLPARNSGDVLHRAHSVHRTVILLPLFVCLRAFGLPFYSAIRSDYDVWAAMPEAPPSLPPPGAELTEPPTRRQILGRRLRSVQLGTGGGSEGRCLRHRSPDIVIRAELPNKTKTERAQTTNNGSNITVRCKE